MKKLCVFDLDGTLTDTLDNLAAVTNEALNSVGLQGCPQEEYKFFAGDGAGMLIKRALQYQNAEMSLYTQCLSTYLALFKNKCSYLVKPYADIPELLNELKARGMLLCVYSNKPHDMAIKVVTEIFGERTFDNIIGQRDNHPVKPNPEGVTESMEKLGIKQDEVIYIGDTNTDIATGKNAGVFTVGVTWGFRSQEELEEAGADVIIDRPMELLDYLD